MDVTLNIDCGELPGEPEELYALATIANVACGGHAGDAASMEQALRSAVRFGTRVAAHPSYPDREGFGRVRMPIDPDLLRRSLTAQCGILRAVAERYNRRVTGVKPHGALYHEAARDPEVASLVLGAAVEALGSDLFVVGPPEGALASEAARRGLRYAREGFADRAYVRASGGPDEAKAAFRAGRLVPRGEPGALLDDGAACADQALALVASGVVDTLCVHGDLPGAVARAQAVRSALERAGALPPRR